MRQKINENPAVALGVIAVVFFLMLYLTVLSGDDAADVPSNTNTGTASRGAPAPAGTPDPVDPGAPVDPGTSADPAPLPGSDPTPVPPVSSGSAPSADGLLPTEGLPEEVLVAYARNKTIALLVFNPTAPSDLEVRKEVNDITIGRKNTELFLVSVDKIADYSRITGGVGVDRTPALVVIRPRDKTGNVPTATVSYGYRGPKSIEIALEDAETDAKQVPVFPND